MASEEALVRAILAANRPPWEAPDDYHQLVNTVGLAGVRRLQTYPNDTVAIRAAWEEVALTVPEKEDEQARAYRPDRQKLDWFLGFLEGRGRVQSPKWWADVLLNAVANRRDNFHFDLPGQPTNPAMPRKSFHHEAGFDDVWAPLGTTLRREGSKIVLRVGKEPVTIPEGWLGGFKLDNGRVNCGVSALITPSRCYIALHQFIGEYSLECIERSTLKLLWSSEVRGGAHVGIGGGLVWTWVTVTEQNDRVVVFGCDFISIHAEGFRSEDGANIFRFANAY